jgi:predicted RNase H-related nuclease YkuK (DUF458 family)
MLEHQWRTFDGQPVDIHEEIDKFISDGERVLHVATDGKEGDKKVRFTTCFIVLKPGKGGRIFHYTQALPDREIPTLRTKLFKETWFSLQTAMEINEVVPEETKIIIHVDANVDVRYNSSRYLQELAGMVTGQGFEYLAKPDAWAASHCADHIVNGKHQR